VRWKQWKVHFVTRSGYYGTKTTMELPWLFNLRQDPFEYYDHAPGPRAEASQRKSYIGHQLLSLVFRHVRTLQEYPPRQRADTLNIARRLEEVTKTIARKQQ
jgi:arylsulfatase